MKNSVDHSDNEYKYKPSNGSPLHFSLNEKPKTDDSELSYELQHNVIESSDDYDTQNHSFSELADKEPLPYHRHEKLKKSSDDSDTIYYSFSELDNN